MGRDGGHQLGFELTLVIEEASASACISRECAWMWGADGGVHGSVHGVCMRCVGGWVGG